MIFIRKVCLIALVIAGINFLKICLFAEDNMILMISSSKTVYRTSEQILIECKIIKLSKIKVSFIWPPSIIEIRYLKITEENNKDKIPINIKGNDNTQECVECEQIGIVPRGLIMSSSKEPGEEKLIELEENEFIGNIIEISQLIDNFREPGTYCIKINYSLGDSIYPICPKKLESEIKLFKGDLISNSIKLKIINQNNTEEINY